MRVIHLSDSEYVIKDFTIEMIGKSKFCVFDFEATGPDQMNDYITQIGAVILGKDGSVVEQYKSLVRPPIPIPAPIEKLTGIFNNDVKDARTFSGVIDEFVTFINGCVLVTQAGYEFDLPLLLEECQRNNKPLKAPLVIDTKALFSYLHPEHNEIVSTNFLINYYKIDDTDIRRHDALEDSILISRIFNKLLLECFEKGIDQINFDNLKVKKVRLSPLH